jgi:hypothetical protein
LTPLLVALLLTAQAEPEPPEPEGAEGLAPKPPPTPSEEEEEEEEEEEIEETKPEPKKLKATQKKKSSGKKKRPGRGGRRRAPSGPVEIPIDIGVGPVAVVPNPPVFQDQPVHGALALSLAAVIDQDLIKKYRNRIPPGLRGAASRVNEVRVRPWFLAIVPELIIISPQFLNTGMYGAVWRPVGLGISLVDEPVHISVNAGLDLAYIFIHSRTLGGGNATTQSFTHFARPGINLDAILEIPITDSFLVSTGWSSDFFVPQPLGGTPLEIEPLDQSLWHLGGPFLKLHFRVPFEVSL